MDGDFVAIHRKKGTSKGELMIILKIVVCILLSPLVIVLGILEAIINMVTGKRLPFNIDYN